VQQDGAYNGFGGQWRIWVIGLIFGVLPGGMATYGQSAGQVQRERVLEEPWRLQMDQQVPAAKRLSFDYGGW
jgi:hypothetical protein